MVFFKNVGFSKLSYKIMLINVICFLSKKPQQDKMVFSHLCRIKIAAWRCGFHCFF